MQNHNTRTTVGLDDTIIMAITMSMLSIQQTNKQRPHEATDKNFSEHKLVPVGTRYRVCVGGYVPPRWCIFCSVTAEALGRPHRKIELKTALKHKSGHRHSQHSRNIFNVYVSWFHSVPFLVHSPLSAWVLVLVYNYWIHFFMSTRPLTIFIWTEITC
jgi:hypothetical protein